MRKNQFLRVQGDAAEERPFLAAGLEAVIFFEPRKPERFAAINFIAHNLQSHMAGMDAHLMRALGQRFGAQQGITGAGKIFEQGELCPRLLAMVAVNADHIRLDRMRRQFGVHFKFIFQRFAAHERDIFELRFFRAEQVGECDKCRFTFGEEQHAGGVKVDTGYLRDDGLIERYNWLYGA